MIKNDVRHSRSSARAGFTIVEVVGTCLLLAILFSMTIPMLLLVARERRATEQRQFALQHIANLLESTVTHEWPDIRPGDQTIADANPELVSILPGLQRTLVVSQPEDTPLRRQITATIRWQNHAGQLVAPIRLSAWAYPGKEVPE